MLQSIHVDGVASGMIAFDHDAPGAPSDVRVERRRDAILSRARWQFADRLEAVIVPESSRE